MITDRPVPSLEKEPAEISDGTDKAKLIAAIEEAEASINRGEFVTLEEIKQEFSSWITK